MAKVKKAKKAQDGKNVPTYKNLRMGVNAKYSQGLGYTKEVKPSKEDSAEYRFGYGRGLKGEKEFPGEGPVQKMGRWEGQNVKKTAAPKKKMGGKTPKTPAQKKFASLAPPKNKITFADKIAGAKGKKVSKQSKKK